MTTLETRVPSGGARLRVMVRGVVQGVGFRPFIYRLANELGLSGWVNNSPAGVVIEVEGLPGSLEQFRRRLESDKPPHSSIQNCEVSWLAVAGYADFQIRASNVSGDKRTLVMPDIATCPDCLREIFDPASRRYRYPFTNCTHCGPRFSIIIGLPYDRANTTLKPFRMCPACQAEYDNPDDRRFHAQPNACPDCGPQLELWPGDARVVSGEVVRRLAHRQDALLAAAHIIRCGQILAVKGIGGFHLLVDARNDEAVRRLRERKHREEKPLALMFPTLERVKEECDVLPLEERLLGAAEAPIVLLRRRPASNLLTPSLLSPNIAPGNPNLGVMLPANPVHHLLMAELGFPVVATSGNLSDEPICTDEFEALERLRGIADVLLVHNRPIVRHLDDSIVRVMLDREIVLRRGRGYAPLPIPLQSAESGVQKGGTILAVGAHLKNSVALAVGNQVFLSQHIGDLETEAANKAFLRVVADLPRLCHARPEVIVADLHPDYLSTKFVMEQAQSSGRGRAARSEFGMPNHDSRLIRVQHHVAHVLSCLAENEVELPALGVAWDGSGYGYDGTIWGGEFFMVTKSDVERVAYLRPFPLPGGDVAMKEPRRSALGILYEMGGLHVADGKTLNSVAAFSDLELAGLKTMLDRGINVLWSSSIGRLFDAVASLTGLRHEMRFEGQAAMELEFVINGVETDAAYPFPLFARGATLVLDWSPMIEAIILEAKQGVPIEKIAAKFHNALAEAVVRVAKHVDCSRVALSGGCFQNRYLAERTVSRLRAAGFQPYWHQRVPPNDGGIALGQVVAAWRSAELMTPGPVNDDLHTERASSSPIASRRTKTRPPLQPIGRTA